MRWIFLSPHLDDAVLSAGGLIRELSLSGIPTEIWTLTAGFPPDEPLSGFARQMHTLWGFSSGNEAVQIRRSEDHQAASILGASTLHFDFLDAIYRQGPGGEWIYPEDVSTKPHPLDADLPARIAEAVSVRLLPDDEIVSPLAVGGHVDHTLVRMAAELLERRLWFYADIPYLFNHPEQLPEKTTSLECQLKPISNEDLEFWVRAVQAYASQLSTVFSDPGEIPALLREYTQGDGGICLWRRDATGLDSPLES